MIVETYMVTSNIGGCLISRRICYFMGDVEGARNCGGCCADAAALGGLAIRLRLGSRQLQDFQDTAGTFDSI